MRMVSLGSLLAVGGLLTTTLACDLSGSQSDKEEDATTTNTTTDDDADDDDEGANGDTAAVPEDTSIVLVGYNGEATITEETWTGTEALEVWVYKGIAVNKHLCDFEWKTASQPTLDPAADCVDFDGNDCEFAFTVLATEGAVVNNTSCDLLFDPLPDADGGKFTYGFTNDYVYQGTSYGPVMMYYFPADPNTGDPAKWGAATDDVTYDATAGTFEYTWVTGGYYVENSFIEQFP